MKLAIGVREGDTLKTCRSKASAQSSTIAAIALMPQQTDLRPLGCQFGHTGSCIVTTSIIYYQNLIIDRQFIQRRARFLNRWTDAGFLVVGRQYERQTPALFR